MEENKNLPTAQVSPVPAENSPAEAPDSKKAAQETAPGTAAEKPKPKRRRPVKKADDAPAQPDAAPKAEEPAQDAASVAAPASADANDGGSGQQTASAPELPADEIAFAETGSGETEEIPPEQDEKRLLDMTRTVQLSIEQIMANIDDNPPQPAEEPAPEPEEDEEEPADGEDSAEEAADTVADRVRDGLSGMAKWALLTCVFVLVIAVGGIIWLYRSATPDMLPQLTVTFNGVEVEPSAYKWHVPVVGNMFKRTYAKTLNKGTTFATPVDNASPDITLSSRNYDTSLTVTDSDKDVIFEGTVAEFSAYRFNQNGTYTAKLVATAQNVRAAGESSLTGSETWLFTFDIAIRPSVTLSESSITQGGVVAVRVSKTQNGQAPVLQSGLKNAGFVQAVNGWICYVPIPWNAETGTQTLQVVADGYTEPVDLTIRAASWDYKDYTSESQRSTPYIGADDAPAKVKALLTDASQPISWADGGFIQPFLSRLKIKATFGMTEYVGRSYKERSTNYGYGGRTTTNVVVTASKGDSLIAPASGKVLLAQDLSGDAGLTLVIDHGAGVKSIFYNLASVDVKVGAQVKQGQLIATCSKTVVAEMRIGTVPIDPLNVWRGQCNGLKYY